MNVPQLGYTPQRKGPGKGRHMSAIHACRNGLGTGNMGIFGLFGIWLVINWAVSLGLAVLLWEKLHATQGVLRKALLMLGIAAIAGPMWLTLALSWLTYSAWFEPVFNGRAGTLWIMVWGHLIPFLIPFLGSFALVVLSKASANGGFASMAYYPFACLATVICHYASRG